MGSAGFNWSLRGERGEREEALARRLGLSNLALTSHRMQAVALGEARTIPAEGW